MQRLSLHTAKPLELIVVFVSFPTFLVSFCFGFRSVQFFPRKLRGNHNKEILTRRLLQTIGSKPEEPRRHKIFISIIFHIHPGILVRTSPMNALSYFQRRVKWKCDKCFNLASSFSSNYLDSSTACDSRSNFNGSSHRLLMYYRLRRFVKSLNDYFASIERMARKDSERVVFSPAQKNRERLPVRRTSRSC